jgi:hypothetical protein
MAAIFYFVEKSLNKYMLQFLNYEIEGRKGLYYSRCSDLCRTNGHLCCLVLDLLQQSRSTLESQFVRTWEFSQVGMCLINWFSPCHTLNPMVEEMGHCSTLNL